MAEALVDFGLASLLRKMDVTLVNLINHSIQTIVELTVDNLLKDGINISLVTLLCLFVNFHLYILVFFLVNSRYHIPREFLNARENHLTLFNEFGGTPDNVNVQTVTVGTVCGHAYDGHYLELSCQGGRVFSDIKFASFGEPQGSCGSFRRGSCEAPYAMAVIRQVRNHICIHTRILIHCI